MTPRPADSRALFALVPCLWLLTAAPALAAARSAAVPPEDHPRLRELGCGTVLTAEEAGAYLARLQSGEAPQMPLGSPPPYYVPIAPHIVRRSDGTGGLSEARYHQANADANLHYQDAQIVFYTKGTIDYIDDDDFYFNIDTYEEIDALRTTNTVPDAVNIYFTEVLNVPGGALCGISAFTFSSVQAIAMRNSCTANDAGLGNHSTYSHEIGHYFDLFHTHETAFGLEYVDGSNCDIAGDLLCDTPADPRLGSSNVNTACQYIGSTLDPQGDPYDPDPTLLMSYSLKHCRDLFTPQSLDQVVATLVSQRPNLITAPVSAPRVAEAATGSSMELSAARPNPTAGLTELSLALPASGRVEAVVYDVRGARVRTIAWGHFEAGTHVIGWDGTDDTGRRAGPGIYFARVSALGDQATRKVQLVR